MNNSVFDRTLENIRNRVYIRLISSDKVAQKLAAKPNYVRCTIFDENLIAVHKETKLYFNKPVYLGMSILDLSKFLIYDIHYNYIKTKYGDDAKLLFTDTDSLAYEMKIKDFYKDINPSDIEKRFDTSDYPTNHPSGIKTGINSKVLGMFKDEAGGKLIVEFVGLRAKLYSDKMLNGSEDKKCKGVSKNVTKRSIEFDDYRECLISRKEQHRKMNVI